MKAIQPYSDSVVSNTDVHMLPTYLLACLLYALSSLTSSAILSLLLCSYHTYLSIFVWVWVFQSWAHLSPSLNTWS